MRSLSRIVVRADPTGMLGPVAGPSPETDMQLPFTGYLSSPSGQSVPRWLRTLVAALACLLPIGCGAEEQDSVVTGPGPRGLEAPTYWLAREDLPHNSRGLNIRAVDPIQLQIIIKGADATPPTPPAYRLRAGETARIWWRTVDGPIRLDDGTATGKRLRIEFGFVGQPAIWTTADAPGGTHEVDVQRHEILPPPSPEAIPMGTPLELVVLAGASLPEGQLRIRPRPSGSQVSPEGGEKAVLRLLVKAEPVADNTR